MNKEITNKETIERREKQKAKKIANAITKTKKTLRSKISNNNLKNLMAQKKRKMVFRNEVVEEPAFGDGIFDRQKRLLEP